MNNPASIAIIGAGPAGLACAEALLANGVRREQLQLFEKSRGVGGRLAVRRRPGFEWQHGAASVDLTAASVDLTAASVDITAARAGLEIDGDQQALTTDQSDFRIRAPGHQVAPRAPGTSVALFRNALKARARDLPVHFKTELAGVKSAQSGIELHFTNGRVLSTQALLLCMPAPQVQALLERSAVPERPSLAALEAVRFEPRWSLLLGLRQPLAALPPLPEPFLNGGLSNDGRSLVLHSNARWSTTQLEASPTRIRTQLLQHLPRVVKAKGIHRTMAHRWRYALPQSPVGKSCLWDESLQLGAAGDWCLGATVGAALASGVALADRVTAGNRS